MDFFSKRRFFFSVFLISSLLPGVTYAWSFHHRHEVNVPHVVPSVVAKMPQLPVPPPPGKVVPVVKKAPPVRFYVMHTGSLKSNITALAAHYGWHRVIWRVPFDYTWQGTARVSSRHISFALKRIIQAYPLQAQLYLGNHVLVIVPRTVQ